jgi:arylsulfatase A-like enzyme
MLACGCAAPPERGRIDKFMLDKVSRLALACALAATAVSGTAARAESERPNILLIITDDVGQDVVTGMYPGLIERLSQRYGPEGLDHPDYARIDGKPASTPVLDQFARDGMVFTDAWAQPFCSPTRASLLTGLNANKTNVITYADALSQHHDTFVRRLADQGYSTAVFGKWHMAGLLGRDGAPSFPGMKPKEAGFEFYRGDMNAALPTYWNYPIAVQDDATGAADWRSETPTPRSLPGIAPTTFADVAWTADAVDWIGAQERADPDKPWFAWVAFNLAHATIIQKPSAMMIPDKDTLDAATIAEIDACGGEYGTQNTGTCSGEAQLRAMTNAADTLIGKILDEVDRVAPNTYVIIIGDNGTPMYPERLGPNLNFIDNMYITRKGRGKGTTFESGARVELAIRGPGIAPGSSSSEFVHVTDLFSTILGFAGLTPPETVSNGAGDGQVALDAVSLLPIVTGQAATVRDPVKDVLLTEDSDLLNGGIKVVGARNRDWKLVCSESAGNCRFYNLASDPLEEYPLDRPAVCTAEPGSPDADDPAGNYCYLESVVATQSILKRTSEGS